MGIGTLRRHHAALKAAKTPPAEPVAASPLPVAAPVEPEPVAAEPAEESEALLAADPAPSRQQRSRRR